MAQPHEFPPTIDVILAARKVGKEGGVGGVDFSPQMIERAKKAVIDSGLQQWDIKLRVADMGESQLPEGALMSLNLTFLHRCVH